jgi:tetratricopeptide (TPR) repeat protein
VLKLQDRRMPTSEAAARLERFLAFVQEDPQNLELLADTWEAAMAAGDLEAAARLAEQGEQGDPQQVSGWLRRRAHVALARRQYAAASRLVDESVQAGLPLHVAAYDRACLAFVQSDFAGAVQVLRPLLDDTSEPPFTDAIRSMWLRALHRLGQVDEAWTWVAQRERAGRELPAGAAGAASLLAIDADDFGQALALADRALAHDPLHVEALTARGCVALAQGDAALARSLLMRADGLQPGDGRIQSALGLVSLQAGAVDEAQQRFQAAVAALPSHIGSWHGLGWSFLLQGALRPAADAFARALAIDANFGESHGAMGLVLVLQGEREAAQEHLRRAHKLEPRNVTASFADALASGRVAPSQFGALARRLLDRPGFFGEKLSARWDAQGAGSAQA